MLAIPAKRADVVDFTKPLTHFFSSKFPKDSPHFQNDITSFQQLRSIAVAVTDPMDTIGQQQLMRYHYHASVMVLRLNDFEKEMKLNFSWYDAYRPSRRFTSSDIYFDIAGILWNIASFESTRAARVDRHTDEGIRQASRGFQQAAGILEHLQHHVVCKITSGLSPDLTNESIDMAKSLMLAQAQACFYEKAVRDRKAGGAMKPAILSKLAFEAGALFSSALTYAKVGTMLTALDVSWSSIISYQVESFHAAAEYWMSLVAKDTAMQQAAGYGVEIARLMRAEKRAQQAINICQHQPSLNTLAETATALLNAIRQLKASAEHDNSKIYLEQVPNPESLPEPTGAKMVKALDFPEYQNTEKALFKDFTSSDIRAMVDTYRSQADTLHRQLDEAVNHASNNARSSLSAQGLPGSLEMYKSGGQLPENLWMKIEQIQRLGGVQEVQHKLAEVLASAASANTTLENINHTVQRENHADDMFRRKYTQYTANMVPFSDQLFSNEIKDILVSLRQACESAAATNTSTQTEMNSDAFKSQCRVLSMSKPELSEYLNSTGSGSETNFLEAVTVDTSSLESSLVTLASLLERRDGMLASLRTEIDNSLKNADDQFMQHRISKTSESKDDTISFFVSKLNGTADNVRSMCQKQDEILSQIRSLNEVFLNQRQSDTKSISRDQKIKTMEEAVAKFFELHGKLASGENFYTNLQMRLSNLHRSCDDIVFSQQLQRQEFEQSLLREHERQMQDKRDYEMAKQLNDEFSRMSTNQPPPAPTPFSNGSSQPWGPEDSLSRQAAPGQPVAAPQYGAASQYPSSAAPISYQSQTPVASAQQQSQGVPSWVSEVPIHQGGQYHPPPTAGPQQTRPYQPAQPQQSYSAQQGSSDSRGQTQPYGAGAPSQQYPPASSAGYNAPASNYSYGGAPYSSASTAPAAPAPQGKTYPNVPDSASADAQKLRRLTDMGFESNASQQALNMYNGNEEAAVNYLLGGGSGAGTTNIAAQGAAPAAPEKAAKKGWW